VKLALEQDSSYRADLSLGMFEAVASNDMIADKFRAIGFVDVTVTGSGRKRQVVGTWPLAPRDADLPSQVSSVEEL
jgi:hypothetical protein